MEKTKRISVAGAVAASGPGVVRATASDLDGLRDEAVLAFGE